MKENKLKNKPSRAPQSILLALAVVFIVVFSISFTSTLEWDDTCNIEEKYKPRWGEVERDSRADFLKAIWEDGILQDFHIVIENCEVIEFYPSSKKYNVSFEDYQKLHNRTMENINKW